MTAQVQIGIQLPEVEYVYSWPQLVEMAILAEDIGLDSLWFGDHLMYRYHDNATPPRGPFESWTTLAALAAVTKQVKLGHLVASLGFHQPAMIAKMSATVDQISNGRFILGVGAGWHEPEYRGFGFPFDHRFGRFQEAYNIIRMLFATGECTFHGEYYHMEDALLFPKTVQAGGPPIMIGSFGDKMLAATMGSAQMWNAWSADYDNDLGKLAALIQKVDGYCEKAGRDPSTLSKSVAPLIRMGGNATRKSDYGSAPPLDGTDPAKLTSQLNDIIALGIDHLQLVLDPITPASIEALVPVLAQLRS